MEMLPRLQYGLSLCFCMFFSTSCLKYCPCFMRKMERYVQFFLSSHSLFSLLSAISFSPDVFQYLNVLFCSGFPYLPLSFEC
jgi:hypothetical protein